MDVSEGYAAIAVQTAGHNGTVAQNAYVIPQSVAETNLSFGGGKIGPIELISVFEEYPWRKAEIFCAVLPRGRETLFEKGQNLIVAAVFSPFIPKAKRADNSFFGCAGGKIRNGRHIRADTAVAAAAALKGLEGDIHSVQSGGGEKLIASLPKQRAVGGEDNPKAFAVGNGEKFPQIGMEQRLSHKVEIEKLGVTHKSGTYVLKFLGAHKASLAAGAGTKRAFQVADICDFKIDFFQHSQFIG